MSLIWCRWNSFMYRVTKWSHNTLCYCTIFIALQHRSFFLCVCVLLFIFWSISIVHFSSGSYVCMRFVSVLNAYRKKVVYWMEWNELHSPKNFNRALHMLLLFLPSRSFLKLIVARFTGFFSHCSGFFYCHCSSCCCWPAIHTRFQWFGGIFANIFRVCTVQFR